MPPRRQSSFCRSNCNVSSRVSKYSRFVSQVKVDHIPKLQKKHKNEGEKINCFYWIILLLFNWKGTIFLSVYRVSFNFLCFINKHPANCRQLQNTEPNISNWNQQKREKQNYGRLNTEVGRVVFFLLCQNTYICM